MRRAAARSYRRRHARCVTPTNCSDPGESTPALCAACPVWPACTVVYEDTCALSSPGSLAGMLPNCQLRLVYVLLYNSCIVAVLHVDCCGIQSHNFPPPPLLPLVQFYLHRYVVHPRLATNNAVSVTGAFCWFRVP